MTSIDTKIAVITFFIMALLFIYRQVKKQEQLKKDAGKLLDDLDKYMHLAYDDKQMQYLEIFKARLLTLEDEEDVHFYDVGLIEFNFFTSALAKSREPINKDLNEKLKHKFTLANNIGILENYIQHIETYINSSISKLEDEGLRLFIAKVS